MKNNKCHKMVEDDELSIIKNSIYQSIRKPLVKAALSRDARGNLSPGDEHQDRGDSITCRNVLSNP